jgi:uncharacterized repeat protein (TIGR01451 family)
MFTTALRRSTIRVISASVALLVALATVFVAAGPAFAEGPSVVTLSKSASSATVTPGQAFSYSLNVQCTAVQAGTGCTNATLVDPVPSQFIVTGVTVGTGLSAEPQPTSWPDNTVTVVFNSPLADPAGGIGLLAGTVGQVIIAVQARTDLTFEENGVPVDNTGTLTATNAADPSNATATVTPDIPLNLATTATKTFDPTSATATPGDPVTLTINGTNTSNAGVTELILTDPTDPTASPNPFDLLEVTSIGAVTMPPNANQVEADAWNGVDWIPGPVGATPVLPASVATTDIHGVRFTFSSNAGETIQPGATASVQINLVQRPEVATLTSATVVENQVQSSVILGGQSATGTGNGNFTIQPNTVTVGATKTFTPSTVVAGDPTTVTIGGSNDGAVPITELQLTEPTQTDPDPTVDGFPAGTSFDGFTDPIAWPTGATSASVHYYFANGTDTVIDATAPNSLPAPPIGRTVVRFTVTFEGTMQPGDSASIPFVLETDPSITTDSVVVPNSQTVTGTTAIGTTGSTDATADLTVFTTRLATTVGKTISPNEISASAGEFVTVSIPSSVSPFPESTTDAQTIVVQDPPGDPPALTDWWNHFNATAITQTAVPANATLSIEYWDGTQWLPLPVLPSGFATGIAGPTIYSATIDPAVVDDVQGLRFTYTATTPEGFPPGTTVQPNVTMNLRSELRDGSGPATGQAVTVENCAEASAANGGVTGDSVMPSPCPAVTLVPGGGAGGTDFLDKTWVGPHVITARTDDQVPVLLNWSTGGRANLGSMVITDAANPDPQDLATSAFNSFDLVAIPAITSTQDPLLEYDEITGVELYVNGVGWQDPSNDPCLLGGCVGTFPGMTLTADQQASTIGVRFTFAESPNRAAVEAAEGDPTAPPVGSGVARSTGNNREILLTMQLRDDVRDTASPGPVVATRVYNTGTAGEVSNAALATGTSTIDGSVVTDTASDIIRLLDVPLNVSLTKTWVGGPLGVPPLGTDAGLYPSSQITLTATNQTAANVDQLNISDPSVPGATTPFNDFDMVRLESISIPAGATSSSVVFSTVGGALPPVSVAEALAEPQSFLLTVTGIEVIHTGRVDAGASSTVVFDARLRARDRNDGTRITAAADSPVPNEAQAGVIDEGGEPGGQPTATADASIVLEDGDISVVSGKTFSPATQTEPDDSPVTMTLSGTPGGSVRTTALTLTDDTGTFWNAFDYVGLAGTFAFADSIDTVETDVCIDRTFTDPTLDCEAAGGHWVLGDPQNLAQENATPLPNGVTAADVEGLRYIFTRADGGLFQSPNPIVQQVNVSVQRRADLRSGGPVPSDLASNAPAPGETAAGTFTNTMTADVVGAFEQGGAPFLASDSTTSQMRFVHLVSSVTVQKSPSGIEQPGTIIPYALTVTNNGQIAITDPVITDYLPTDADGPMLVFDPFASPTGPGPYTYTLAGGAPAPASGPAMPTDPTEVDAVLATGGAQIQFSFPPGTVLEVGQTYTITIALMFRTGLAATTNVTNTFGVVGDRPFDTCGGTLDPTTGECDASTTVTVQTAGALRGIKTVRAEDPSLGVDNTVPSFPCAADADNFYSAQCAPITKPGGNEIWRLSLINTGTVPMDRMVAVDKLPTPGDTAALTALPRGSQWRPTYTGTSVLADAPAGATLTQYYTTDAAPCVDDLATTGVACPAGAWTLWDASVDPTTVTGLKFVVDFATPIQPAASIAIDVTTRTPGFSPTTGVADPIAWNTVAVAGRVTIGGTEHVTPETEGNEVGVAMATGPLSVEKDVTGAGAAFAPTSFTGTLQCTSAGETLPDQAITLVPGTPTTVNDLPLGADCTVTEDAAGQTSSTSTHATVGLDTDPIAVVTVTNEYDLAGLVVTKNVDSSAVDQDGTAVEYGPFTVAVTCTFLGNPVFATGYSSADPMTAELTNGESLSLTGLPAGASCIVDETDAKGATSSTIETTTSAGSTPSAGLPATVTLTPDVLGHPTNTATIVNSFDVGSLDLTKIVQGPGALSFGGGPFTFTVTCTLDDASGSRVVWDGTVVLGGGQPLTATIDNIATGAVCGVTETGTGGATTHSVSPESVTVGSGTTVDVTATNTFLIGTIQIIKSRLGDGADLYGAGPFQVTLLCTMPINGLPSIVQIPGGNVRTMSDANGYLAVYALLPVGASCIAHESKTGGATTASILDSLGRSATATTVAADTTIDFADINTFDVGSVRVTKSLTGAPPADGSYVVHLECTQNVDGVDTPVEIPDGADRTLSTATSLTTLYDNLPTNADCTVTELNSDGATTVTITPNSGDAAEGTVTVGDDDVVDVSVVNYFDPSVGLAFTGTNPVPLLLMAIAAMLGGALLLIARRMLRRRT